MVTFLSDKKRILIFLLTISVITRFVDLSHPNEVVFDEVHWGKFISGYCCTRTNFFDVHPPHGKLFVAALTRLSGYIGDQNFDKIGTPYQHVSAFAMRAGPALFGTLIPALVYLLLLELGVSSAGAFLGGFLFMFDNALVLQSRIMGLYPMLLFSILASLWTYLLSLRYTGRKRGAALISCGLLCGLSLGLQFTGILALGVLGLAELYRWRGEKKASFKEVSFSFSVIATVAIAFYLFGWWVHFERLPLSGSGDAFYRNTGQFWPDLVALHKRMYTASNSLVTPHPESSHWWKWPLMLVPIYYWKGNDASLYFLGNPVFWWGTSVFFVVFLFKALAGRLRKKIIWGAALTLAFTGYFVAFFPLTLMKRVLFLYHYLTPLSFSLLFVLVYAERLGWFELNSKKRERVYLGLLVLTVLGFFWIVPVTYGLQMPPNYWKLVPWRLWH